METKNWYAWMNLMPPKPDDFHVVGEILASNPGILPILCLKEPQGVNPEILLLDLHLIQQPGMWPQVMTWVQARYDRILPPGGPMYKQVEIFHENKSIAQVPVEEVH